MKKMKRIAAVAATVGLAASLSVVGVAAPANAATLAPACIEAHTKSGGDIFVQNNCSKTKRVKVVMSFGRDLACLSIKPGDAYRWNDPRGSLDKVVLC
jgi:hypothetical protein